MESNGILHGGVYNRPRDKGIGEACIWGDSFYFEGLKLATRQWTPYW